MCFFAFNLNGAVKNIILCYEIPRIFRKCRETDQCLHSEATRKNNSILTLPHCQIVLVNIAPNTVNRIRSRYGKFNIHEDVNR